MKKISIKRKALTCLSTAALLAAMAPGVALAETGSKYTSDITVNGVQAGDTVTAYELVDSVVDANNNKTNTAHEGLPATYPVTGTNEQVADYVANNQLSDLTSHVYDTKSQKATGTSVTFKGLDDGAWLIVVTNAEGHTRHYKNTVVNNDAKVVNGAYAVNHQIADVKSEDTNASKTINNQNVQLGQTYTFTVNFAVPSFAANTTNKKLTVTDTPTGFKDDTRSIVVKNGDNTVDSSNYKVTPNDNGGFTISFTDAYIAANPNQQLTLTYDAKVTSVDALTGKANNHVTVNDSYADVNVQTYGYEFKKVAGDTKDALSGAEFTLYDAEGKNEIKDANGNVVKSTSARNGYVAFSGLADGATYTVKETKVPAGYQKVNDFTFTVNGATSTGDNDTTPDVKETNFGKGSDVVDAKQGVLPTTGGAGTIGLTVAGVVLVAGGATLVLRARKNNA